MRRLWRILVWLLGIAIFLAAFGYWQWQRLLTEMAITDLRWEMRQLGLKQLQLTQFSFTTHQADYQIEVAGNGLALQWRWRKFMPQLEVVSVSRARLVINDDPMAAAPEDSAEFTLPQNWRLPDALPALVTVKDLQVDMPCASGRCAVTAQVRSQWARDVLNLQVQLKDTPTPVNLDVVYQASNNEPQLRLALLAPEFIQLNGATRLLSAETWQGNLQLNVQPPHATWLEYLQNWRTLDLALVQAFDQPSVVSSQWNLALPTLLAEPAAATENTGFAAVLAAIPARLQGEVTLTLDLPSPLPIPNLGGLSGQARIDLAADAGIFTNYLLDVDLRLDPLTLAFLADYDIHLDSLQVALDSRSDAAVDLQALPLQIQLAGEGNLQFTLAANVQLNSDALTFSVSEAELQLAAARWAPVADINLANLDLKQKFSAHWQAGELGFSLLEPGEVQGDITSADFSIKGGKLNIARLILSGDPDTWLDGNLETNLTLSVAQLVQADLHPQPWRWEGEIKAGARQARVQGKLTANNSVTLDHTLIADEKRWQLDWKLPDIFLLAGNSLQLMTPHWPPLLILQRGRMGGEGQFSAAWPEESPITGKVNVRLTDVAGIYDTTAFVGVSGAVDATLGAKTLSVASKNLTAREIIQGFTLGPARAALAYSSARDKPMEGKLRIDVLQSALLGGSVEIPATTLDFAQAQQLLQIDITELDLARLLAEHPTSDLSGSGRLSGSVPLTISAEGFSVTGGKLAARPPGGFLQYRSAKAADMAASSQGMKIITDALDDFHYTLLSSEVSYDTEGTLLLGVRLEGKNPAVEAGRPINFNINLEEDLPAMIFSLQLTNQLNEIIKKRVQEKMRRKPAS